MEKKIITKVKTDRDKMCYDAVTKRHHHSYSMENEKIEEYLDEELERLITDYFRDKKIPGFQLMNLKFNLLDDLLNKRRIYDIYLNNP